MEDNTINISSKANEGVRHVRDEKAETKEPVKLRNESKAIPSDTCQRYLVPKTMKPFLSSVVDRLISSVSRANTTAAAPQKEIDEDKSITALEAFMEANTDEGVREEALQCWDDHKGCPISKAFHKRKRHAAKSRKCASASLSRRLNRKSGA